MAVPGTTRRSKHFVILDVGTDMAISFQTNSSETGRPGNYNFSVVQSLLSERWCQFFGRPRMIRVDPEGPFRSEAMKNWRESQGVEYDVLPAT